MVKLSAVRCFQKDSHGVRHVMSFHTNHTHCHPGLGPQPTILIMLTPFSHYLQSNQAPTEDETNEIKALRTIPLEEISIIDVEIKQIEGILNSLKRKRAHIQESIDNFNTILAPVRRLSTDVLGVIFSHCLATHRNSIMSASEAPILLTQICHEWRSIALSIPRLWSRLYIPTLGRPPHYRPENLSYVLEGERRMEARIEEVQRWLRLSAACPLAITMMPAGDPISHPPLLDTIIQSSRRWQQLELSFLSADSDILTRLLSLSPDDLCMLRELRIYSLYSAVNGQEVQEDLLYQSGLLTAQGLRSISIANIQTDAFPAGIPPNWKNLNHLFIHSPILLGLAHSILSYCSNLVACLLKIAGQWDDIEMIPDTFTTFFDTTITLSDASITLSSCILPHLTFLSLQGDLTGCSQLFNSIEAPSLQILDYQGHFPSESEEFGLLKLLQNVNSLETLRVDNHRFTESSILKYSTLIPSVTHLVLGQSPKRSHGHFPSLIPHYACPEYVTLITTLQQYSPDSAPTVLFPSLEIFEAYYMSGVTDMMFLEFIKARIDAAKSNTGVSKLKKVLVSFSRPRQTDIVPEALAYAHAAGMKLELELTYFTENMDRIWSPSFGLFRVQDDISWSYPLY